MILKKSVCMNIINSIFFIARKLLFQKSVIEVVDLQYMNQIYVNHAVIKTPPYARIIFIQCQRHAIFIKYRVAGQAFRINDLSKTNALHKIDTSRVFKTRIKFI